MIRYGILGALAFAGLAMSAPAAAQGAACASGYEWNEYSRSCTWRSSETPTTLDAPLTNRLGRECTAGYEWSDTDERCVSAYRRTPMYEKNNEVAGSGPDRS